MWRQQCLQPIVWRCSLRQSRCQPLRAKHFAGWPSVPTIPPSLRPPAAALLTTASLTLTRAACACTRTLQRAFCCVAPAAVNGTCAVGATDRQRGVECVQFAGVGCLCAKAKPRSVCCQHPCSASSLQQALGVCLQQHSKRESDNNTAQRNCCCCYSAGGYLTEAASLAPLKGAQVYPCEHTAQKPSARALSRTSGAVLAAAAGGDASELVLPCISAPSAEAVVGEIRGAVLMQRSDFGSQWKCEGYGAAGHEEKR